MVYTLGWVPGFRNQLSPTCSFKQKPGTHSPGELNKAGNLLASFLSSATRVNQGTRTISHGTGTRYHICLESPKHSLPCGFQILAPKAESPSGALGAQLNCLIASLTFSRCPNLAAILLG